VRAVARGVEDDDPESAAVQRRAGAVDQRAVKRVGVVRHEHDDGMTVLAAHIVGQVQRRRGLVGQRGQVLARAQEDGLDLLFPGPLGQPGARGLAVTGPGVDEQHGPARRLSGPPAIT
jgi:hypothetical protein